MPAPAPAIGALLAVCAPAFTARTFARARLLLSGTRLAGGPRPVAAALRAVGRGDDPAFGTDHRVLNRALNRARWSPLVLRRLLLGVPAAACLAPDEPLQLVVDETLERRRGRRIAWRGWLRDPVRSGAGTPALGQGVRRRCVALPVPVPRSGRRWACPVLTVPVLAPATSANAQGAPGKRQQTTIDRAQLLIRLIRRWQPDRTLILSGDGGFAATPLGHTCDALPGTALVTRLRLDAALDAPPTPPPPGRRGRQPKQGARHPSRKLRLADPTTARQAATVPRSGGQERAVEPATGTALGYRAGRDPLPIRWVLLRDPDGRLKPTARCCTDPTAEAAQVVAWFVARWASEVTVAEARAHPGLEPQRQWSPTAMGRMTPCRLGPFSRVVLLARTLHPHDLPTRQAAWYAQEEATFK